MIEVKGNLKVIMEIWRPFLPDDEVVHWDDLTVLDGEPWLITKIPIPEPFQACWQLGRTK